jgi:AcrR family transcriptional regulator
VYNYFKSKDEIYLHVLTRGFELLYEDLTRSIRQKTEPLAKLEAIARAQARFGFEKPNYYDLMFTWHVPKFNDFLGTDLEPLAFKELQAAMKSFTLFLGVIEEIADQYGSIRKDEARLCAIQMFAAIHGIVAFKNNTILYYVHEDPDKILDSLLDGVIRPLRPTGK